VRILFVTIASIVAAWALYWASGAQARGEFKREVPFWWLRQALCVHHREGSWRDPHAPYYGGMQMDLQFARTYGGWMLRHHGTPDHWSPRAQLIVAHRGWLHRGWWPWPNTARACGLL